MTDLLIRDVPDQVLAAIDANAKRLGLSRTEYVRRRLAHAITDTGGPVTPEHLKAFTQTFSDLEDREVMSRAWR